MTPIKLGRKPRKFDARVPHYSALVQNRKGVALLPPLPAVLGYTKGMPADLGMMLNDRLGDCTAVGFFHLRQLWKFNTQKSVPVTLDEDVLTLYEQSCGYDPDRPDTDEGGVEQDVLAFLVKNGARITGDVAKDKPVAFFEVDPRNRDDILRSAWECGGLYLGMNVPDFIMNGGNPPDVWDFKPGMAYNLEGGHCIALEDTWDDGPVIASWGRLYRWTWAFFQQFVDESYGIVDTDWVNATGKTPAGMSLGELEALMQSLKS